jgi:hypothetical protein
MKHIKLTIAGIIGVVAILIALTSISVNDNGERRIVQYPTGYTFVKFDPGWYFTGWGTSSAYSDNITFDFQQGLPVRYQDGGQGSVEGIARFSLPADDKTMLNLHKAFRGEEGLRNKMLNTTVQEALNLTAGLMTSEEAYAEKRAVFTEWSRAQVTKGKFLTELVEKVVTLDDGSTQKKNIPVIRTDKTTGFFLHSSSDLESYGVITSSFTVSEWNFGPRTITFIDSKRDAEMAIITAKANTNKAEQEKLEVIANGEKDVAFAQYKEEEKKVTAEVQAERIKSVALIQASQATAKAMELTLAAVEEEKRQFALAAAAIQEAKVIKTLADAEAYKLRETQKGGELKLRLDNDLAKAEAYAKAMAVMQSPEVLVLGSGDGESAANDGVQTLVQFKAIEQARTLANKKQ